MEENKSFSEDNPQNSKESIMQSFKEEEEEFMQNQSNNNLDDFFEGGSGDDIEKIFQNVIEQVNYY